MTALRPSRHHGTPQPLSASSRFLAHRRVEAQVADVKNERGVYPFIAMGRFESIADAKKWADRVHPDAPFIILTAFTAHTGWRPQACGDRRNGVWL
jgi:hypothetical protein